jgi:ABC-type multidrug transport system ATPase subunit
VSTLGFEAVSHGELSRVTASFASGSHVVLGSEHDGTGALIELAAGLAAPAFGRVRLDGKAQFSSAAVRGRVAALCAVERLPPARTVTGALTLALRARGDARSVHAVLDAAGIAHFAMRRYATLSASDQRALACALALTHPTPSLLALFEPLLLIGVLSEEFVLQSLARANSAGAIVLTSASRVEDALRIGGTISSLVRGAWLDESNTGLSLAEVTLRVRTPEPRRLAARLSEAPQVNAVEWSGGKELLVRGADLTQLAKHVVASARSEVIRIEALRCEPPSLEALAAARAGAARACYERAQRAPRIPAVSGEPPLVQTLGIH